MFCEILLNLFPSAPSFLTHILITKWFPRFTFAPVQMPNFENQSEFTDPKLLVIVLISSCNDCSNHCSDFNPLILRELCYCNTDISIL